MASLANLERRLAQIEAKAPGAKSRYMGAPNGVVPDDYRPSIDTLIVISVEGEIKPLMWRGEPYDYQPALTLRIGGEE